MIILIVLHEVSKSFGQIMIFHAFSHRVETGELLCIMGPSGIGKTTLLHLIAGLQKPDQGIVELDMASRVGYVFQEPRLLPWCTVAENVEIGLLAKWRVNTYLPYTGKIEASNTIASNWRT